MKSKLEQIMKIVIILQILTVVILPVFIENYKKISETVYKLEEFDFTEEIRDINFNMTKEDIYALEGRSEDLVDYNMNWEILNFNNAKMNDYTGIIRYFFDNEKLISVKFEFQNSQDYKKYMKEFRNKYSEGRNLGEYLWTWNGYIENFEVVFIAYDDEYIIEKGEYYVK